MKKIYFLFFLISSALSAYAQPQLTFANIPAIGDSVRSIKSDTVGISAGAAGINVTWNFANMDSIGYSTITTIASSGTPYSSIYPSANLCGKVVNGTSFSYQYYNASSSAFDIVGSSGNVVDSTIYSNTDRVYTLPINYLSTWSDSSIDRQYIGTTSIRVYTGRHSNADGYGTLILPNASYTNVLRYRNEFFVLDSIYSGNTFSTKFTFHIIEYFWVSEDYKGNLLYLQTLNVKNGTLPQTLLASYTKNPWSVLSTGLTSNSTDNILGIYPNPFNNSTTIKFNNSKGKNYTLTLYDTHGQIVQIINNITEDKIKIEKQNLTNGLYFFQLWTDQNVIGTGKLIMN